MAEEFTGSPAGFVQVEVLGNVCTGAVILFSSSEHMHKFVDENKTRASLAGCFLKPNRGPLGQGEQERKKLIWEGKQMLIKAGAGLTEDNVLFSRQHFWRSAPDGEVVPLGKIEGDRISWGENAPANLREE